ncbi:5'-nucleotidase YfbR domain protein [Candidatus Erwinia dacicola]|uniref:5'-nucleotidase YfbR domain protein n=3 Tax=Candidatus Erwinia dacicola TaxID=252393 RepID=A0A328TMR5_9GAMM|nr:5'-nucleotidase YfbR domain protein [Candidatus Erwinia dacicola]
MLWPVLVDHYKELRSAYALLINEHQNSAAERAVVKQADALCAYLKYLEELSAGNNEFLLAKARLEKTLAQRHSTEMGYFV